MHLKTNVKPFFVHFPLCYNQTYLNALGFEMIIPSCPQRRIFSPSPEENRIKALTVIHCFGAKLNDQWRNKKNTSTTSKICKAKKSTADNNLISKYMARYQEGE